MTGIRKRTYPWQDEDNQTDDADQCCPAMATAIRDPEIPILYGRMFREWHVLGGEEGDQALTSLRHCPFCGQALPESLDCEWVDEQARRGYSVYQTPVRDPEALAKLPGDLTTDQWWKAAGL